MKIKDIGEVVTGKTPSTNDPDNFNGDIMFVTPTDLTCGYKLTSCERTITEQGFQSILSNTIDGTSVLVGCIGSDMGNVAFVVDRCATNQQLNAITNIRPGFNPLYIYYYLSMQKVYLRQLAGMTTTPILSKTTFQEIDIPCPCKCEQDMIVCLLSSLDEKIQNNNNICAELEAMAKTLYDYWFVQFDFPDADGRPYRTSGGAMVWNEELKREVPVGWGMTNIASVTRCHDSKRVPVASKDRDKMKGSIPYYGATEIMGYVNDYIFDGDYVLLAEDGSVMNKEGFPIIQRITGKTWVNNHAHVLEPLEGYSCRLLMLVLSKIPVTSIKTGSIQMKINQENLNMVKLIDIPQDIKERINDVLIPIDQQMLALQNENRELAELRDWLLPMLMNGQARVV